VGVIWQMTDSFCDAHTCRTVLRGGCWYAPLGSAWYFPAALRLDEQNTLLELSDSMDRSGGIGFRCVADAAAAAAAAP
jgi:iron(II)-dependent oxidoreductase